MKILTLGLLIKDGKLLLAMKKRGFGTGKWNGYGGKLKDGESVEDALIREIKEEGNVDVKKENLIPIGYIDFYFNDKEEFNQSVQIFKIETWEGEPQETEEMKPEWFEFEKIPWKEMWVGDDKWIPFAISNKKFKGEIHFDEGGKKLASADIHEE